MNEFIALFNERIYPAAFRPISHYCRCRKLPPGLKEWQAFNDLKKKIDNFNALCPLLERMLDKAMMERHWKRIEEVTKWRLDVESDGFLLKNVMEAPLLSNVEDIEVYGCIDSAEKRPNNWRHLILIQNCVEVLSFVWRVRRPAMT